jgi:hypothetical protein
VRERDLAGEDRIVAGHVRLGIMGAVLQLDVHPEAELLEIEAIPVDADRVANLSGALIGDGRGSEWLGATALRLSTEQLQGITQALFETKAGQRPIWRGGVKAGG